MVIRPALQERDCKIHQNPVSLPIFVHRHTIRRLKAMSMRCHRRYVATWSSRQLFFILIILVTSNVTTTEMIDEQTMSNSSTTTDEKSLEEPIVADPTTGSTSIEQHHDGGKRLKTMTVGTYHDELYCLNNGTQHTGDICNESNEYIIIRKRTKILTIPDVETLEALVGHKVPPSSNASWIPVVDPELLAAPSTEEGFEPLQSLKKYADNPDEYDPSLLIVLVIMLVPTSLSYSSTFPHHHPHPQSDVHFLPTPSAHRLAYIQNRS